MNIDSEEIEKLLKDLEESEKNVKEGRVAPFQESIDNLRKQLEE